MTTGIAIQNSLSAETVRAQQSAPVSGTVLLGEQAMREFRSRPLVVLSPHFDDACFSLGGFLGQLGCGDLVNIFTQGDHMKRATAMVADQQRVHHIRDSEDAAFALRCGLRRHDIGCEEPSLRGRRPSQLHHIDDDMAQITQPVLAKLGKLAAPGTRVSLFAPLGIGRHVNHRATAKLILGALAMLHVHYDVFLYEELPYAGKTLDRLAALRRAGRNAVLGTRYALRSEWAEKKSLLQLYASQLGRRPARRHYWPRALSPLGPHEAFWAVTPMGAAA